MNYFSALAVVLGIASALISIREFIKKGSWRPGVAFSVAAVVLLVAAGVVANLPFLSGRQASGTPSTQNTSTLQSGTGITPTPMPSPTSIPVTPPVPTSSLPCTVNLSTWTNGSSDWKVLNGVLLNDGTNDNVGTGPSIIAPCQLRATNNYAVETNIQVTQVGRDPCFGITVRGNPTSGGWQGYKVGIGSCACCNTFSGGIFLGIPDYPVNTPNPLATFDPGVNMHTYRVEVKDNSIKFFIDGALTFNITDNSYLNGSEVGLWCENVQLEVTSFKVVVL